MHAATELQLGPNTRIRKASALRKHILPTFAERPIGEITQPEVRAWVAKLATVMGPGAVSNVYSDLQKIMDAAVDADLIFKSPCHKISLPRYHRPEQRYLTLGELVTLADATEPRYRALMLLGGTGGLRIGEMAGLRRERVDLFTGQVTVAEQLITPNGKASLAPLKSKASRRIVRIPKFALEEMRRHFKAFPPGPENTVFSSLNGSYLRPGQFRVMYFRKAAGRAGIIGATPHTLRHTAVSLWVAGGANAKEVQRMAGHSNIRVTYDTYAHLFPEHEGKIADSLDARFADLGVEPSRVLQFPKR